LEANLPFASEQFPLTCYRANFDALKYSSCMGRKKKNRAANPARRAGKSRLNPRPARRKSLSRKKKAQTPAMPVLEAGKLKDLYSTMVKCRVLAERMHGDQNTNTQKGEFTSGLEAMFVGAGAHLLPHDCVALEHGGSITSLIKGTPLQMILSRSARAGDDFVAAPELTMNTAFTLAQAMKGQLAVTLMFCPKSTGALAFDPQVMGLAASEKLPLVALMEAGFNAETQTDDAAPAAVGATYYPRITVDGCDVVAVFRVTQEAVRRARQGHGPALIECVMERTDGTGDEASAQNDPLAFMEHYLRRRKLWSDEWARSVADGFSRELDEALASRHQSSGHDDLCGNREGQGRRRLESQSQKAGDQEGKQRLVARSIPSADGTA
jgi:TPP-dependent pyruvate/acetoin dehydrogenase alpha subunit